MPHCQKEKHDHSSKSKKAKQAKKEAIALARKAKQEALEEAEREKLRVGNNLALKDGFGEYEVGCEEEMEYVAKFNMNKRSKKHLRMDIIKQQQKAEREAEELLRKEQEEAYRLQQQQQEKTTAAEEKEEELVIQKEVLVYICLCCNKKFNTVNAFKNHTESKKHRDAARLYEEAGVIVTEVLLADELEEEEDGGYDFEEGSYGEDVGEDYGEGGLTEEEMKRDGGYGSDGESEGGGEEDEEEEDEEEQKVGSLFSALAAFSDSSSSSSSSSESSDDDEEEEDCTTSTSEHFREVDDADDVEENADWDDDLDLLEDIIYQNRLQERLYPHADDGADKEGRGETVEVEKLEPVVFDDEQYDIDNFNADRLAAVQHRLQKRLAAKGIEPSQIQPGYKTSSAVSVGKTLLQELMEASVETRQQKLAQYKQHKAEHQLLGREFRFARGNSKALASQYSFRIDPSDNARQRANVHHAGSHYHMAAARSMYYGRSKGLMARHSSQGSRLQASRMAAKEVARVHGKGMGKVGKTSKKSTMKRRGEAGGSKKSGGMAGASEN